MRTLRKSTRTTLNYEPEPDEQLTAIADALLGCNKLKCTLKAASQLNKYANKLRPKCCALLTERTLQGTDQVNSPAEHL